MTEQPKLYKLEEKPEPMAALQARYPAALMKLWDIDSAEFDLNRGPGKYRENVFDTENGLRIMVSREKYAAINGGEPQIHVSVSVCADGAVEKVLAGCLREPYKPHKKARETLLRMVRNTFAEISGLTLPKEPFHVSETGIPHWSICEESGSAVQF